MAIQMIDLGWAYSILTSFYGFNSSKIWLFNVHE